jgi:FixJ family two-component response regulator
MSGHGGAHLAERAGAAGVSDVLCKPLQKRDLAESLAKVLAGQTGPTAASASSQHNALAAR